MDDKDALVVIFSRNAFYKRLHYLALAALALNVGVIVVLAWICVYLLRNPTAPLFFATDNVGRLIKIVPVNTPNMTLDQVIQWTNQAVQSAYSYDYINYRAQLQSTEKYFTSYGWGKYIGALTASNNLVALTQRKMIAIAQVVDKPKILAEGILGGAYAWKFQMPILVTYYLPPYDDKTKFSNPLQVTVIVQRQQVLEGDKGLGIVQLIGNLSSQASSPQEISGTQTGT